MAVSLITVQTTFAKPGTPITLIDNGRISQCETTAQTVGEFLSDNAVELGEEDVVSTDLSAPLMRDRRSRFTARSRSRWERATARRPR